MDMSAFRMLATLVLSLGAFSQTFDQTVRSLQANNPPDAVLTLRIQPPARFHEGELIPYSLTPSHRQAGADRFYRFNGFLLSPAADCGQLSKPCLDRAGGTIGGFSMTNAVTQGELNGHVPKLKPGHYRLAALAVLEVLKQSGPLSRMYGYTEPREYLVSNAEEFEIVPATREWQRRIIAEAVRTLSARPGYQTSLQAARRLRYLQTPAAWEAALGHLDRSEDELLAGLAEASDKKAACALLGARLTTAQQSVTTGYLWTLARICASPEAPPMPKVDRKTAEGDKVWMEWGRQTQTIQMRFSDRAATALAAHLNEKTPTAKSAAVETLVQYAASRKDDPNGTPFSQPAWLAPVRREVIREWPRLTADRQRWFLAGWQWRILRGPEMAPALEAIANRSLGQSGDVETWRLAIKRLNELEPAKGQARIIEDMLQPASRVDDATLALLPPDATKDLPPRLIQALAGAQSSSRGNWHLTMELLARCGDANSLPRIRAIYESQTEKCQPELLAYFLRVDPAYAERILPQPPWDMHVPAPPCAMSYFAITARLYMSPELERFMTAYLMHSNVDVKRMAAESLGKHGTAAAAGPLWDALRYYHDYWKDRRGELKNHLEGERLELALRNAIARGAGWLATEAEVRSIAELCLSARCQYETANDLQNLRSTPTVQIFGSRASVAQYSIDSLEALENKLAQFPAGTTFQLRVEGPDRDRVIERLRQFGARKQIAFRLAS